MTNGVVVQLAVFSALAAILICLFIVKKTRKERRTPAHRIPQVRAVLETSENMQLKPMPIAVSRREPEETREVSRTITMEIARTNDGPNSAANLSANSAAP